jgi:hypothetical protein
LLSGEGVIDFHGIDCLTGSMGCIHHQLSDFLQGLLSFWLRQPVKTLAWLAFKLANKFHEIHDNGQ